MTIKQSGKTSLPSQKPWVIVVPTYAWRIPNIVYEWLEKTKLEGNKDIYFVMTCGGNIGNAQKYLQRLCSKKGLHFLGCLQVVMPENYIALFTTPSKEEALITIQNAESKIQEVAALIYEHKVFPISSISFIDSLQSGIINSLFYPTFVHSKKFKVNDTCISCKKCEQVCPLNNIQLVKGKPVWSKNCTHCMACISYCPSSAIEYGKHSVGLPRYTCPK